MQNGMVCWWPKPTDLFCEWLSLSVKYTSEFNSIDLFSK